LSAVKKRKVSVSVKKDHGASGERHGMAVLDWDKVAKIRKLRADGETLRAIAEQFNCGLATVRDVVYEWTWRGRLNV
jgi:hypothetical protein